MPLTKPTSKWQRFVWPLAFFCSFFFLYSSFKKFDLHLFAATLREIQIPYLVAALGVIACIPLVKTAQWWLIFHPSQPVSFKALFQITASRLMAVNILPLWGGEGVALLMLSKEGVSKTKALSVLAIDHLAEGFALLGLFSLVIWQPFWTLEMKKAIKGVTLLVLLAYFLLVWLANRYEGHRFSFLARLSSHLKILRNFRQTAAVFMIGFLIKILEGTSILLLQSGFNIPLPFWVPLVVLTGLNLAMTLPVVPGYIGVFEASFFIIYQWFGLDATRAASLGLFFHLIYFLPLILMGYASAALKWRARSST